jgi:hypothetical protein
MPTVDDARKIALSLPRVTEGTSWGTPSWKVTGGKLFMRVADFSRVGDDKTLVLKCEFGEREALRQGDPETFFLHTHYERYEYILVRTATVDPDELRELITEAWRMAAPPKLAAQLDEA